MDPKVVVINGTRIITERVLSATGAIFLNMHAGVTPLYRGVHGAYWALVSNDPEHCGVTVHVVDKGIDTGSIVAQAHIAPAPEDSFVTYPYLQLAAGLPLLEQAVREALGGNLRCLPAPPGESRLWSHPGIIEYLRNRISSGVK
jgi:folate-dependent phosphoribosylglycinamide formyltransferase PurN